MRGVLVRQRDQRRRERVRVRRAVGHERALNAVPVCGRHVAAMGNHQVHAVGQARHGGTRIGSLVLCLCRDALGRVRCQLGPLLVGGVSRDAQAFEALLVHRVGVGRNPLHLCGGPDAIDVNHHVRGSHVIDKSLILAACCGHGQRVRASARRPARCSQGSHTSDCQRTHQAQHER